MIKFFRKFRQKLLTENPPSGTVRAGKFGKPASRAGRYFIYAIGEILLVIIGILIALWINEVYKNSQNNILENEILIDIKNENTNNREQLTDLIEQNDEKIDALEELSSYINVNYTEVKDEKLDKFIHELADLNDYNLSQNIISSVINSGKISLIKNKDLGYLLAANTKYVTEYYKWIEIDEKYVFNELIPFFSEKYSIKNTIGYLNALKETPINKSSFPIQKKELLTSVKFESMVSIRILNLRTGQNRAKKLLDYIDSVIENIDMQLKFSAKE